MLASVNEDQPPKLETAFHQAVHMSEFMTVAKKTSANLDANLLLSKAALITVK